jgi:carbohydrate kinase (thermoresistant glucokinase family)
MSPLPSPVVLVIMGVSGAGKSTIGLLLAERLGWPFEEGDSLHPASNVEKMSEGIPLTDEDRWPWLARIADWIDNRLDTGESGIITCSALKRSYRNVLNRRGSGVEFVYLAVEMAVLTDRVEHREDHFMPASLLTSQLGTLEIPTAAEPAIQVDADPDARLVVDRILRDLDLTPQTIKPSQTAKKPSAPSETARKPPRKRRPASPRQTR